MLFCLQKKYYVTSYEILHFYLRFFGGVMAHNDTQNISEITNNEKNDQQATQQQLADANKTIAELKLQIAWLERSYE